MILGWKWSALVLLVMVATGCAAEPVPFRVVLDPGHTPAAPGALSCSGETEFKFNAQLAADIVADETGDPLLVVSLSRPLNKEVGLLDRVNGTGRAGLFLSIHHDSVQPVDGTVVEKEGRKGFCTDKAAGFSLHVSRKNPHYARSLAFARLLGKRLLDVGLKPNYYHAKAIAGENEPLLDDTLPIFAGDDLVVLKRSQAPAVLLEAGVIANQEDERVIASVETREAISRAIREAVKIFIRREEGR